MWQLSKVRTPDCLKRGAVWRLSSTSVTAAAREKSLLQKAREKNRGLANYGHCPFQDSKATSGHKNVVGCITGVKESARVTRNRSSNSGELPFGTAANQPRLAASRHAHLTTLQQTNMRLLHAPKVPQRAGTKWQDSTNSQRSSPLGLAFDKFRFQSVTSMSVLACT